MKKILFVNQDTIPYVDETDLARLGMQIPHKLQESGCEVRIFMPLWGNINERRGQLHEVIRLSGLNININDYDHPLIIKVASIPQTKLQVYFIDNDEFFSRKSQTTDADGKPYDDNGERAVFFARGVIETVKKLHWIPDYVVCNGWMSAFLPLYAKGAYNNEPAICNSKILTAIYNQGPEQTMSKTLKDSLYFNSINPEYLQSYKDGMDGMELAKIAIDHSDGVIAALPDSYEQAIAYAQEAGKKVLACPSEDDTVSAYTQFFEEV
ncbi:MAG: glycogen/starch synthase [Prevotella sp.]|nr:glycogen/starch synthase [Prevotella sp.]